MVTLLAILGLVTAMDTDWTKSGDILSGVAGDKAPASTA